MIEVGGVIVLPAKQDVGYEHARPGGHGYAERNQEALEGADECGGEEGYIDYSDYGQHGGDGRCECPRELDAEGEQGQTIGVVVHDGPSYQPQHRHNGEWNQIPGRQYAGHGSDGVVAYVFGQAFVGDGQKQAVDDKEDVGDGGAEGGPDNDSCVGGAVGQVSRVVRCDVDPSQAKACHHEEAAAQHGWQGTGVGGGDGGEVDIAPADDEETCNYDRGDDGDDLLEAHDQVVAVNAGNYNQPDDYQGRDDFGACA